MVDPVELVSDTRAVLGAAWGTGLLIGAVTCLGAFGLILHTSVGIGYETPWRQVESLLLMAASRTPRRDRQPARRER